MLSVNQIAQEIDRAQDEDKMNTYTPFVFNGVIRYSSAAMLAAKAIYDKHMQDTERLKKLLEQCGHWQDGSCQTVVLSWDDATKTAFIVVDKKKRYYVEGSGFEAALDQLPAVENCGG